MAAPKRERGTMGDETMMASDAGAMADVAPEAPSVAPAPSVPDVPPTLHEAFHTLCKALYPLLEEDMPAQMHSNDIRAIYEDGNHVVGWQHAVMLLEQVLGARIGKP